MTEGLVIWATSIVVYILAVFMLGIWAGNDGGFTEEQVQRFLEEDDD